MDTLLRKAVDEYAVAKQRLDDSMSAIVDMGVRRDEIELCMEEIKNKRTALEAAAMEVGVRYVEFLQYKEAERDILGEAPAKTRLE